MCKILEPHNPTYRTTNILFVISAFTWRSWLLMKELSVATHAPCWDKRWIVFFFFLLMNALTMWGYASLVCHWRRWCHLSAVLVTAQGVYCCSKVSHLKRHSLWHKWQDAAPCTCSGTGCCLNPSTLSSLTQESKPVYWTSVSLIIRLYHLKCIQEYTEVYSFSRLGLTGSPLCWFCHVNKQMLGHRMRRVTGEG